MPVAWSHLRVLVDLSNDAKWLLHVATGIYIWEIMIGLPFDLAVLRMCSKGAGPNYARTMYLACRYLTLISMIVYVSLYNRARVSELDCKVWVIVSQAVGLFAVTTASTLIAIRVIAIWNRSVIILGLCVVVLTADFGESVYELSQITPMDNGFYYHGPSCVPRVLRENRAMATAGFAVNVSLLITMLVGLLKLRDARRSHGIWKFLWWQGLAWFTLAIFTEVPRVVFVWSNLYQPTNMMLSTLEGVALSIGATRMYRALWTYDQSAYNISTLTTFKAARPAPTRGNSDG
ncbi:hypothetical protein PENSPDRAFT_645509 [Peniophora sp. CONT]|nr:hypothetical protein PENSPDRAFT_645509 [Peniophora sp. CONT]